MATKHWKEKRLREKQKINQKIKDEEIVNAIYEYIGTKCNFKDYHIFNMQTYCVIKNKKHVITTVVEYAKNNKCYKKIFENVLERENETMKTITIYELIGLVKDDEAPKKIKYKDKIYYYHKGYDFNCMYNSSDYSPMDNNKSLFKFNSFKMKDGRVCWDDNAAIDFLNDTVEIIEEMTEEEKYVRGWNTYCKAVYDMNNPNSKEEPTTCEEFAKKFQENCKMFQPEEKKIPKKIETYRDGDNNIFLDDLCYKHIPIHRDSLSLNEQVIVNKLNEVIDYFKSKGDK